MITVSQHVGRLAEVRMTAPITGDDVSNMLRDVPALLNRVQGRLVVCADVSGAALFPEELTDRIVKFFRADNSRLARSAIVVGGTVRSATSARVVPSSLVSATASGSVCSLKPSSNRPTRKPL